MNIRFKLILIICLLLVVFMIGVLGYSIIEEWSPLESAYMTVITLSSVGFQEVRPLSANGKVFTIVLIILGISTVFYGFATITAVVVEGRIKELIRRRKMERNISSLKEHVIVCGIEETARCIIEELERTRTPFVIVNNEVSSWLELMEYKDILYVEGDPSEETVLKKAGVEKAKGLISALGNDTQNVFVVLTARELNSKLRIVARVAERESEQKFLRAGADAVVCPNFIGGLRLASEIIRPVVVDFLDVMMRGREITLRIEEVGVSSDSRFINQTLAETGIGQKTGVIVIAIREMATGKYVYNPSAQTRINRGDVLITLGEIGQIESLRKIV